MAHVLTIAIILWWIYFNAIKIYGAISPWNFNLHESLIVTR